MQNQNINTGNKDTIQSLIKAFKLLEIISKSGKIGVTELAKLSNTPKTTVLRILNTFKEINVVAQDPETKMYYVWLPIYDMGKRVFDNFDVYDKVKPFVKEFVSQENVDALIGVLDNDHVMYIDKCESGAIYRIVVSIGTRIPLLAAASGRSILAYQSLEYRRKIFSITHELKAGSNQDLTWESFDAEMVEIREKGYCIDKGYHRTGVCAVGIPVFGLDKTVKHSITFPQLISEIDYHELELFANRAKNLSSTLYK